MKSTDPIARVLEAAVELGLTVHEVGQDEHRAAALQRAGVGLLSEPQWLQLRERLVRASAREGGSKRCELCEAPVMWVATTGGARMPVDPLPTLAGNVLVLQDPRSHRRRAKVLTHAELGDDPWPRFRSHFATCPRSAEVPRHRAPARRGRRLAAVPATPIAVEVRVDVLAATHRFVRELGEVLERWPGRVPVRIVLTQPERSVTLQVRSHVEPCDGLAADLKVLLAGVADGAVRTIYQEEGP